MRRWIESILPLFCVYENNKMKPIACLFLFASLLFPSVLTAGVHFPYRFAPSEGFTNRLEKPYRDEVCLNGSWNFQPGETCTGAWEDVRIRIPSPWNANGFAYHGLEGPDHRDFPSYPASWNSVREAWMQRTVHVPAGWGNDRVILHFEAVAGKAQVFVDGKKVAENFDLFLPFEADVTDLVTPGADFDLRVFVQSQKLFEDRSGVGRRTVPAGSMWGSFIDGIWQDVYLLRRPVVRVDDVYIRPLVSEGILEIKARIRNDGDRKAAVTLSGSIVKWLNRSGKTVQEAPVPAWEPGEKALDIAPVKLTLPAGDTLTRTFRIPAAGLRTWTPDHPDLYALLLTLGTGRKTLDTKYERFGWREWTLEGGMLCLNGEPYPLRGDSWHFMGIPQMTRRYAWAWFTAIKGMNGNAVRPHAQVYPRFYLDLADEMGICVLEETANWASDGGPALENPQFWEHSREHLRRMVLRDRNHASVFGWSVSNENKPVILHVHKRPDLMPLQEQAWRDWVAIVRENDPSRPWISSDGEEDGMGILPVTVGHYGDEGSMREWKALGKPWGVGEHSMAYYGTPQEVSRYNGDRAYESALGRMEGLAYECYHLIRSMREAGASYSTVFNMAWYALKPLPLGKKDLTTAPTLDDGIFFGPYEEGVPGVQPERLGPYGTTFNPGYDPALPLWDPWPLFDAMRAANAPEGSVWCRWQEQEKHKVKLVDNAAPEPYTRVVCYGAPDSRVRRIMQAQGVVLSDKPKGRTLSIVDAASGAAPPADGSDVWYWGVTQETAARYGLDLVLTPLRRSSFLPAQRSWTRGMTNADFYFCEVQRQDAAQYTLSGPFVEEGEVLLEACRADWRRWNKRAEEMKTAALLRSEYECTAPLPVFVKNGNRYVSTLDDFLSSEKGWNTLHKLLLNAGVPCTETGPGSFARFDDGIYQPGILTRPVK